METIVKNRKSRLGIACLMLPALLVGGITIRGICNLPEPEALPKKLAVMQYQTTQPQLETPKPTPLCTAPADEDERFGEAGKNENFMDGIFRGTAQGFGGEITVEVTVEGGRLQKVDLLSAEKETPRFLEMALGVIDRVLKAQSTNVDVVSGATFSSRGILNAIKNAISGTKDEGADKTSESPDPNSHNGKQVIKFDEPKGYKDGVYYGSAFGFRGEIRVAVTIKNGRIESIRVLSAEHETDSYFARAMAVIGRIIKANSPNVDVVSSATYSSNGIINAVKRALMQAGGNDEPQTANPTNSPKPSETAAGGDHTVLPITGDGSFDGTAICSDNNFFDYTVMAEVEITDGRIVSIIVTKLEDRSDDPEANDTYLKNAVDGRSIGQTYYEGIPDQIIARQSLDGIDAVSHATYSSMAIVNAVNNALAENGTPGLTPSPSAEPDPIPTAEPTQNPTQTPIPDVSPTPSDEPQPTPDVTAEPTQEPGHMFADGEYEAFARCSDDDMFDYMLKTVITIEDHCITAVSVEKTQDNSDDPEANDRYIDYAVNGRVRQGVRYMGIVEQLITKQSAYELDVVSSATYSSNALIRMAEAALADAEQNDTASGFGTTGDIDGKPIVYGSIIPERVEYETSCFYCEADKLLPYCRSTPDLRFRRKLACAACEGKQRKSGGDKGI